MPEIYKGSSIENATVISPEVGKKLGTLVPSESIEPVREETRGKLEQFYNNLSFPGLTLQEKQEAISLLGNYIDGSLCRKGSCVEAIKKYQKDHKLNPDGIVGRETFAELKAEKIIEQANIKFYNNGLSVEILKQMNKILPELNNKSKNYHRILFLVAAFKINNNEYVKKQRDREDIKAELEKIKVYANNEIHNLESSKLSEHESIYGLIKNDKIPWGEKIKKIATDPTLVTVGGILFLFGVIGGDTKYTNSFFKRLGWIFGIGLFGKGVWNKLGIGEMLDDATEAGKKGAKAAKESYKDNKPKVEKAVKNAGQKIKETTKEVSEWTSDTWENIKKTFSGIENPLKNISFDDISPNISTVATNIENANKTQEKSKRISEENLKLFNENVLKDETFLIQRKENLGNISEDSLSSLFSTGTLQNLELDKGKKQDLVKYVNLLNKQFGQFDIQVRDLFFDNDIMTSFKEVLSVSKLNSKYSDLPEEAKTILQTLFASPYKKDQLLAVQIISDLEKGEINKKKITDTYLKIEISGKIMNLDKLLNNLGKYLNDKELLEETKKYLESDSLKVTDIDTEDTLKAKLGFLEKSEKKNKSNIKLENFKNEFDKLILEKKIKILEKLKIINPKIKVKYDEGEMEVGKVLEELKNKKKGKENEKFNNEKIKFDEEIGKVHIPDITESKIDISKYKSYNEKIQKVYNKLNTLNTNNYFATSWNNFAEFINSFANNNVIVKDNLSKIDKYKAEQIRKKLLELKKVQLDLENKFDVSVAGLFSSEIKEKWDIVRGFKNEEVKNGKQEELKKEFEEKINKGLKKSINGADTQNLLEQIKLEYDNFVTELDSKLVGESVEKAYEEKLKTLGKKEILNKPVKEIYSDPNAKKLLAPFKDFAEKYKDYEGSEIYKDILDLLEHNKEPLIIFITKLRQTLLLSNDDIKDRFNIKEEDIENFKENLKTAIEDYEAFINNSSYFVKIKYLFN